MVLHNAKELNSWHLEKRLRVKRSTVLMLQLKALRENEDLISTFHFKSILDHGSLLQMHPNQPHHPGTWLIACIFRFAPEEPCLAPSRIVQDVTFDDLAPS